MEELLKKLDDLLTNDLVRKIGGLVCLLILVLSALAFVVGAGSILKSMKAPETAAEAEEEETEAAEEGVTEE